MRIVICALTLSQGQLWRLAYNVVFRTIGAFISLYEDSDSFVLLNIKYCFKIAKKNNVFTCSFRFLFYL